MNSSSNDNTTEEDSDNRVSIYGFAAPSLESAISLRVECVYIPIIYNINMSANTFDIKVDIDLSWKATEEDVMKYKENKHKYHPSFVPDLVFENSMDVVTEKLVPLEGDIIYQMKDDKRNYIRQRFIGTMVKKYKIETFPFDVLDLVVSISLSFYTMKEAYFEIRPDEEPFVYVPTKFSAAPGFEFSRALGGVMSNKDPSSFSVLAVLVQIQRISTPFIYRIFLPLVILNLATFSIYAVKDTSGRINILITILLSFVGMIYVLSSLVPIDGKSNVFDLYAMSSVMICVVAIFLAGWGGDFLAGWGGIFLVHIAISGALHIYVLLLMTRGYLDAKKKIVCSFDDATEYLNDEPLSYPMVKPLIDKGSQNV